MAQRNPKYLWFVFIIVLLFLWHEHEVADMKQVGRLINKLRVGQTATLNIYRNGRPIELEVLLAERP